MGSTGALAGGAAAEDADRFGGAACAGGGAPTGFGPFGCGACGGLGVSATAVLGARSTTAALATGGALTVVPATSGVLATAGVFRAVGLVPGKGKQRALGGCLLCESNAGAPPPRLVTSSSLSSTSSLPGLTGGRGASDSDSSSYV